MYKLHIYNKGSFNNPQTGMLNHIEYFNTKEDMDNRYKELFVYEDFGLNPTAWKKDETNDTWKRLLGY